MYDASLDPYTPMPVKCGYTRKEHRFPQHTPNKTQKLIAWHSRQLKPLEIDHRFDSYAEFLNAGTTTGQCMECNRLLTLSAEFGACFRCMNGL